MEVKVIKYSRKTTHELRLRLAKMNAKKQKMSAVVNF